MGRASGAAGAFPVLGAAFAGGGMGTSLPTLDLPSGGLTLAAALVGLGFVASNGEAKRKIAEGAVRIDEVIASDPMLLLTHTARISLGKKKHGVLHGG